MFSNTIRTSSVNELWLSGSRPLHSMFIVIASKKMTLENSRTQRFGDRSRRVDQTELDNIHSYVSRYPVYVTIRS